MDGLDGSSNFVKNGAQSVAGTMFSVYKGDNPTFNDCIACCIVQYLIGRATVFIFNNETNLLEDRSCQFSDNKNGFEIPESDIYLDKHFDTNKKFFSSYLENSLYLGASAHYYADILCGRSSLVLECTRKKNLEMISVIPAALSVGIKIFDKDFKEVKGTDSVLDFYNQEDLIPYMFVANTSNQQELINNLKL